MQILGVAGKAQAGKTTLCQTLAEYLVDQDYGLPRLRSFAGPLKKAAEAVGARKERSPALYRKFCQVVGTEMLRNPEFLPPVTGPEYWVNLMEEEFKAAQADEKEVGDRGEIFVLIDDLRFPEEVALIRRWGGTTLFLDADRRLTDLDAKWRLHESERMANAYSSGLLPETFFDWHVTNNGQLENFKQDLVGYSQLWLGGTVINDGLGPS